MRSYLFPFFLALGMHLLLLCSFRAWVEPPENGLAKGLSSLELQLVTASSTEKNIALTKIQKTSEDKQPAVSKKTTAETTSVSPKKTFLGEGTTTISSAAAGAVTAMPSYLHNPQPLYPEEERQRGHEGTVLLRVMIDEEGSITQLAIEHSSGYAALDHQATQTVQSHWVFRPAHCNGKTIPSVALIPIRFSLKE